MFIRNNIVASFRRSGIFPLDSSELLSVPRPASQQDIENILSPGQLMERFEARSQELRDKVLGEDAIITGTGYLRTTAGCVLKSYRALELIREKENLERGAREHRQRETAKKALRAAGRCDIARREADWARELAIFRRANLASMNVNAFKSQLRSMQRRRALARLRTLHKRSNRSQCVLQNARQTVST